MDTMVRSGNAVHVLLATLVLCAAAAGALLPLPDLPPTTTMNETATTRGLSADFHALSCPQLDDIVRSGVEVARRGDTQLTAGLLRIFFHDCFPQGCDASLLLDTTQPGSEQKVEPQNKGLNQKALQLIESLRDTVHRTCGALSVSCADILAVATKHAVKQAGGPLINMQLGHRDSVEPAKDFQVQQLPVPFADVNSLLKTFLDSNKGFTDAIDVVALSGAHTVGKARCSAFRDRTDPKPNAGFAKELADFCVGDDNRQRNLDEITPDTFDNRYFVDLISKRGVLTSDQVLINDERTAWIVGVFAGNQTSFFEKFALAMEKMSRLTNPAGGVKARRNCLRRDTLAAGSGDDQQGLAASA